MESPIANIQQDGPRVTVEITEREVDTDELRSLVHELKQTLEGEARVFVFRLETVEFLPSACLALLLMFYQEVKKHDGRIILLNCQENVAFLLRLARLDKIFELAEGEADQA
ncbi:STAS domain-containing protein [Algisphaera agarilytica]|uniref:Anti-anti-sigma factor n=1 Tax=Algisphaera agarilytica TaxID=1385975 RepID=A0A7X0H7Y2_9BACT|nr:STAS domain-containing protein [Algisphaera agarilytica]MBB6429474.1 anti-anti-sigma factor [Algisphaera agarilytica]